MRIGLFSDTFPPDLNGVANSTAILRDELVKHGHDVFVVRPIQGVGLSEWDEEHHILGLAGLKVEALYGYVVTAPIHIHALNEIKKLNLDVIHVQTEFGIGIFARTCARQLQIPLVSTYHTQYEDYTHYVNFMHMDVVDQAAKELVALASKLYGDTSVAVIVPSTKTQEMLLKYKVKSRIFVVPTGLQLERFDPSHEDHAKTAAIRNDIHLSNQEKLIVYVGRIAKEKALDLVLEGFARAKMNHVPVKFLVIGGGPDLERLKGLASELHLEDTVIFAGPKPSAEVPDYYRAADAFVSASLSETQGMTFIEAMASGLPLFARKDEVLEELLFENKTGWYFSDADDFASALERFCRIDENGAEEVRNNCLKLVHPWSSEVFYEKVLEVYAYAIKEYREMMAIDNLKVRGDSVQLYLSSITGNEKRIIMTLDDYYGKGLHKGVKLSNVQIEEIVAHEMYVRAYEACLRKLAVKDRTRKELIDYLKRSTELEETQAVEIVDKLELKGFIDDRRYCEQTVNSMKAALLGKNRIIRDLQKKGLGNELIMETLNAHPDNEDEKAREFARRISQTLNDVSVLMKRRKIETKLIQKGYTSEIAKRAVASLDFDEDRINEYDNLRRCAEKAYKRYKRKHEGMKLRNMIYRYCASQGYSSSDIHSILEEMEWEDGKD